MAENTQTETQQRRTANAAGHLKNGGRARALTDEDRRKGGLAKAERARRLQEEARQLMVSELSKSMSKATGVVAEALAAEVDLEADHRTRLSAADRVFDRVAGKPIQGHEHSGNPDRPVVVEHREKLSLRDGLERVAGRRGMDAPDSPQASNTRNSPDGLA